jgi:competence protein ComEA
MGLDEKISDQVTGFLLLLLIVLLLFSSKLLELPSGPDEAPCPNPLFVQVDGDVRDPGVYSFCSTPTVQKLVEKAGGLKERGVVLHPPNEWSLSSGARVVFTSEGKDCDIIQSQMSPFHKLTLGIPLSLNKESEEGLAAVPGIGPSLAKAIVEERTRRGGFRDPEELKDIPGIGPKLYARIRSHLRV